MPEYLERNLGGMWDFLLHLTAAFAILVVGYVLARFVSYLVRRALEKTLLDNHIASAISQQRTHPVQIERFISRGVFYLVMLFALVAFLQVLSLTFITEPINRFLGTVFEYVPKLVAAGILVFMAYVVANLLRFLTRQAVESAHLDERVQAQLHDSETPTYGALPTETSAEGPRQSRATHPAEGEGPGAIPPPRAEAGAVVPPREHIGLAQTLGNIVYYLTWLLFLPAVLDTLELQGLLRPVENMVNEALNFLPNLVAAVLIGIIGYFIARFSRRIVANVAVAAGADRLGARVGLDRALGGYKLSQVLGLVVYVLLLVPVLIAALNALEIEAVTAPASRMLDLLLTAIPRIFAAMLVLVIAFVGGRLAGGLVRNLLEGIGFDAFLENLGLATRPVTPPAVPPAMSAVPVRAPSDVAGTLTLVGIMLFATMEAASLLEFEALALMIADFLHFAGQVVLGLIIFVLGLYAARLAAQAVRRSGVAQAEVLALVARISIVVLAGAMALRQMGLANSIVDLAFGLILGAIALAAALAFGLGGRDFARQQLERLQARTGSGSTLASPPAAGNAPLYQHDPLYNPPDVAGSPSEASSPNPDPDTPTT